MMIKLGYSPSVILKLVEGISPQEKWLTKSCKPIFFGPFFLKIALNFTKPVFGANLGGITKRNMMPLTPILIIEIFNYWGLDFMGPFPPSCGYLYILLVVDYVSKWVEAIPTRTNDHKVVLKILKEHIFFLVLECLVQSLVMVGSIFVIDLLKIC